MKEYKLLIECICEEDWDGITEMFSKGYQKEKDFKDACKLKYAERIRKEGKEETIDYTFIYESKVHYGYGKIVDKAEPGKRKDWSLSRSREYKKGYYPITQINL